MNFFDANAHAKSKPQRHLRSIHVPRNPSVEIQASNFGRIKPPSRLRRIHVQGIQASKSKLRISAASNLQAGFVASTSTKSKLRNPSFGFRQHQTSKPASSHPRPRNPSFGIQASDFCRIKPPSRLRRIHVHGIQASKSMLPISATSNLHAGFVESTSTKSELPISISAAIDVIAAPLPSCYIHL